MDVEVYSGAAACDVNAKCMTAGGGIAMSPHLSNRLESTGRPGPFCVSSPWDCVSSLQVRWLPPSDPKHGSGDIGVNGCLSVLAPVSHTMTTSIVSTPLQP